MFTNPTLMAALGLVVEVVLSHQDRALGEIDHDVPASGINDVIVNFV